MKLYDVIKKENLNTNQETVYLDEKDYLKDDFFEKRKNRVPKTKKKFSFRNVGVWASSVVFIAILYILGMYFVYAKVIINERHIPFSFDEIVLELDEGKGVDDKRLSFQVMKSESSATKQVYTSNLQQLNTKASGEVVFFNDYRTSAVTIKKGTTVTSDKGLKYVTQEAVTIPGFKNEGGNKKSGTSKSIKIVANAVGSNYNSEATTFTVSGYKKDQIHARSAGNISGGESGVLHLLDSEEKDTAMIDLQANLMERLKREARSSIPDDYITYPDLQIMSVDKNSFTYSGNSIRFPASLSGQMISYIIPKDALEAALASHFLSDQTYPDVVIPTLSDLKISPITPLPTNINNIPENIAVSVSGSGTLVAKVSKERVKQILLGIPRKAFASTLQSVSEIEEAKYIFYPFWAPFFPSIPDRINVVIK